MKRKPIGHRRNVTDGHCTIHADKYLEFSKFRSTDMMDRFYEETVTDKETGKPLVLNSNPLYMAFNQQRLNKLGRGQAEEWLRQLQVGGLSALAELKTKLSDEQLSSMVKSRYIQHPYDLQMYIESINSDDKKFRDDLDYALKQLEKEKKEQESQTQ